MTTAILVLAGIALCSLVLIWSMVRAGKRDDMEGD